MAAVMTSQPPSTVSPHVSSGDLLPGYGAGIRSASMVTPSDKKTRIRDEDLVCIDEEVNDAGGVRLARDLAKLRSSRIPERTDVMSNLISSSKEENPRAKKKRRSVTLGEFREAEQAIAHRVGANSRGVKGPARTYNFRPRRSSIRSSIVRNLSKDFDRADKIFQQQRLRRQTGNVS